jgi:polysaccharide pyruvyl transferase WcaK-like protein
MTDIIISPRYHNLVLGMMLNKPVIALSYDYKNEALLTEAGLGEYWQRVEELDVERLIAQFEQAERNSDAIRLLLENVAQRYREQWKNEYSRIFADL